ncbi:putative bifunctional diguanylate cyclase/phosphodiesterase [Catellatospora paridis]|uniref:putative bifunctional diguanylate cyclase/phosphodiesterase n=1 Tax=Catellatospora paridis TaxID=1617086 RepID=UPI0012D3E0E1|nr:bifunctional diguanylate cyclase/phosphodiesterase [Catellatospora paridis]
MTAAVPADSEIEQLRQQLAEAVDAARDAYRDTTRLIQLLDLLGRPAGSAELMGDMLNVLSDAFFADVVCMARVTGDRLIVSGSCGLPEDDPAYTEGWPVGEAARRTLATTEPTALHGDVPGEDAPGSVAGLGIRSAAWIPLSAEPYADTLLVLFRSLDQPFAVADLRMLTSVAARLHMALEERERHAIIEQLAHYGHLLARHLEVEPLLDEAADLLRRLTGADRAWVVTVEGGEGRLRAHRGMPPELTAAWPVSAKSLDDLPACDAGLPETLKVAVARENGATTLLCAGRERRRPFAQGTLEIMTIFANYLGVALTNAELYRALADRATRDPLTGLANRSALVSHLDTLLAADEATRVGVLFCDLDGFKAVNDLLGHEAGDELLMQVADRLRSSVRPDDLLARFGGDEFVIVLDGVKQLSEVAEIGARVCADLDDRLVVSGEQVHVSASIGGVLGIRGQATPSTMLRDADAAMYVAKARGSGQVEVFDEDASHRSRDRLDLRSELLLALTRGQLHLAYQPIFALDTRAIVAFEALLRWTHPHHGTVPPDVFIPLAEETGAIVEIGQWVLAQACRQLAQWHRLPEGRGLGMSVNLSPVQLHQARAAERTLDVIRAAGLHPADIWLEITEHSYLRHEVTEYAGALGAAGVHLVLDDFGTAYSNLSYLKRLPVEILKIDKSFVSGVTGAGGGHLDLSIVRAILAIADSLGLVAIAEGIETEDQRAALRALGCRLGQGYLLSRPLPAAQAGLLLRPQEQLPARVQRGA